MLQHGGNGSQSVIDADTVFQFENVASNVVTGRAFVVEENAPPLYEDSRDVEIGIG
jgi:hypothetical protein